MVQCWRVGAGGGAATPDGAAADPCGLEAIGSFDFHPFPPGKSFSVGEIGVETLAVNHPGGSIAYKLTGEGKALVFIPDIEHPDRRYAR